jgi:hypothetical protein
MQNPENGFLIILTITLRLSGFFNYGRPAVRTILAEKNIKPSDMNPKPAILLTTLLIGVFVSCKKDNQETMEPTVNVHVKEFKTEVPLPGAVIAVNAAGIDFTCSCTIETVVFAKQTDDQGICAIPDKYLSGSEYTLTVSKDNYWSVNSGAGSTKETSYELQVKAQLRLHVVKNNPYPDHSLFQLNCSGEKPESALVPFTKVLLPADTSFVMDAYGGQTNRVQWKILDNLGTDSLGGGTLPVEVARTGITDLQISY